VNVWRIVVGRLLAAFAAMTVWEASMAQYPERPVRMVVGFAAGGGADILGRIAAKGLSERWGQNFIVENRPGGDASIAANLVARADPDGYMLLVTTSALTITPAFQEQQFNPVTSFEPIIVMGSSPSLLLVHPSLPVRSVPELVAYAKTNPGKLAYGSSGTGTIPFLAMEMFKDHFGIEMIHVPFKGGGDQIASLLSGDTPVTFLAIGTTLSLVRAGKLRALAVNSKRRWSQVPDVPTVSEIGMSGFEASTWYGVLAPAKTSKDIVSRLNAEISNIIRSKDGQDAMNRQGFDTLVGPPEQFADLIKSDLQRWSGLAKKLSKRQ
jgi:tripartite-type tricarboxylate transporter receptor subunit TctC